MIDYQGEFYTPDISPFVTDINDNLLEFIRVKEHTIIVGPLEGSLTEYLSAPEWRKRIEEEGE